jgi:hypothetical protein
MPAAGVAGLLKLLRIYSAFWRNIEPPNQLMTDIDMTALFTIRHRIPNYSKLFLVMFLLLCVCRADAQFYPRTYFQSPMDTPLYLSAPFGSLRDNHFHSGTDIRTYEKEGLPVYAVADGYISRIKYSPVGYGKALYIDHPNGYTSVYGHLQNAEGEIATYIRKYQYENERFDFDHFPGRDRIKVSKGQIIGWSGNSGGSTGPHLHFEIRDTRTEEVINPYLFGIYGVDQLGPVIRKVLIYSLDQNCPVVLRTLALNKLIKGADSVNTYRDTILLPGGTIGFAAEAYDYLTNTNEYSIYAMELQVDAVKQYAHRLDRFSFDDSRCINVHIDYELYRQDKIRYQKCFRDDGNRIGIYNYMRNKGKYALKDSAVHAVMIQVSDANGKAYAVRFYIKRDAGAVVPVIKRSPNYVATMYPGRSNNYRTKDVEISVPAKALYDTLPFAYKQLGKEKYTYSNVHQVHDAGTPLQSSFGITIKPDAGAEQVKDKLLIASVFPSGFLQSIGGAYEGGSVSARTSTFGTFAVVADSVAPVIRAVNISKDGEVKDTAGIRIIVEDNLSGISTYRATLNGKWIMMEYDAKNNLLFYPFEANTVKAVLSKFVLTVTDKKNNTSVYQKDIIIAP